MGKINFTDLSVEEQKKFMKRYLGGSINVYLDRCYSALMHGDRNFTFHVYCPTRAIYVQVNVSFPDDEDIEEFYFKQVRQGLYDGCFYCFQDTTHTELKDDEEIEVLKNGQEQAVMDFFFDMYDAQIEKRIEREINKYIGEKFGDYYHDDTMDYFFNAMEKFEPTKDDYKDELVKYLKDYFAELKEENEQIKNYIKFILDDPLFPEYFFEVYSTCFQ